MKLPFALDLALDFYETEAQRSGFGFERRSKEAEWSFRKER